MFGETGVNGSDFVGVGGTSAGVWGELNDSSNVSDVRESRNEEALLVAEVGVGGGATPTLLLISMLTKLGCC